MRQLNSCEISEVYGAAACEYAGTSTMLGNSAAAGATAGMVGFAVGGPVVAGIASAGVAAASMFAHGVYNFFILGYDLIGGCQGYTGTC